MKTTFTQSPTKFIWIFFVAMALSVSSCKDKPADSEEVAEDQNEQRFDNNDNKEDDAEFLVEAAGMDMMEIELGKLAQQSSNQDVKEHGRMMEEEHTKSSAELKSLATQKGIALPTSLTEDGMEAYNSLKDQQGEDFNKKYLDMMVDSHEKAINKYEKNAERTQDADIKAFATKTLGNLRTHLQHSQMLRDKYKNNNNQ